MNIIYMPPEEYQRLHKLVKWYNDTPPEMEGDDSCIGEEFFAAIKELQPPIPEVVAGTHYIIKLAAARHHIQVYLESDTDEAPDCNVWLYPTTASS